MNSQHISCTIVVQARSNSKRFPRKVFEFLGGKRILDHVLDASLESAKYINSNTHKKKIFVDVVLAIPENDPIKNSFKNSHKVEIVEGSEDDVLARFYNVHKLKNSDYYVRLTSDCCLLPSFIISKHINCAILNNLDYLSNVWEGIRTAPDGHDVEIFSNRVMEWLQYHSLEPQEREHVTLKLRKENPRWARVGHVLGHLDLSHIKLSLDSEEDLKNIKDQYSRTNNALKKAMELHGNQAIYRL